MHAHHAKPRAPASTRRRGSGQKCSTADPWLTERADLARGLERNPVLEQLVARVSEFPGLALTPEQRREVRLALKSVFVGALGGQMRAKLDGKKLQIPPDATATASAYLRNLRPKTPAGLLKILRGRGSYPPELLDAYRGLVRVLLPIVKATFREELDANAAADDFRQRLADAELHGWRQHLSSLVRSDLFSGQPKPHQVARRLAARAVGLHGRQGDLSLVQLARLLRRAKTDSWRVREWETDEARRIADRIASST